MQPSLHSRPRLCPVDLARSMLCSHGHHTEICEKNSATFALLQSNASTNEYNRIPWMPVHHRCCWGVRDGGQWTDSTGGVFGVWVAFVIVLLFVFGIQDVWRDGGTGT